MKADSICYSRETVGSVAWIGTEPMCRSLCKMHNKPTSCMLRKGGVTAPPRGYFDTNAFPATLVWFRSAFVRALIRVFHILLKQKMQIQYFLMR